MSILLAFSGLPDKMRAFFFLMSNNRVTGKSEFSGGISDTEISGVLMNAEYRGILVPAWEQRIIWKFRRRLQALMDDNNLNARSAMNTYGADIATELCEEVFKKLSRRDKECMMKRGMIKNPVEAR